MKKIYFLLFCIAPLIAKAQMKTWENFSESEIDHPFKYNYVFQPENNIDSKGNKWVLNANSVWKINGTDTTKFTNFPITNTLNRNNSMLSILDDKVAFWHYRYDKVGSTYTYTNYLGYYNGSEMKYFSETSMNVGTSTSRLITLNQTEKYIWIAKNDKLIRFDKNNTFTFYNTTNSIIESSYYSRILRFTSNEIIHEYNYSKIFKFNDQADQWENFLPSTDSLQKYYISDSTKAIYIAGRDRIYSYNDGILKPLEVPNIENLGWVSSFHEIKKDLFITNFEKGFVLIDNGQVHVANYASYTDDGLTYGIYSYPAHLDNGILVFSVSAEPATSREMYFTYHNNVVKFELQRNIRYEERYGSFFYKTLAGDNYFHFINADYSQYPYKNDLIIVKNGIDATKIAMPDEFMHLMKLVVDSNYVWIRNETGSFPYFILRMKRDQYFVKGNLFYDVNQNGVKESAEVGISKYPVRINPSGLLIYPDRNGNFAFAGEPGEKYIMELPDAALFNYTSQPLPYTFIESDNNQIGITLANPEPEVKTNFITPWPRCGTTRTTTLTIENTGFEPIDKVRLALIKDPASEIHAVEAIKKTDTLIFELNHLLPQAPRSLSYEVTYPGAEMTGEKLTFRLITSIYAGENIVKSVADSITDIVRCAYDPNDKSVTPAGINEENFTLKNSTLNYLIRFENTGNDTAYTVTIHDTLDTHLNLNSFEVLGASHNVITQLSEDGVLIFHFEDIMLPDNKTDEEKAHGFVRFAISPKPDLPENTLVKNQAAIVFDANPPIITNETFNTLVTTLPVITSLQQKKVSKLLYPNPASDFVHIAAANPGRVEVFDATGKQTESIHNTKINTSSWEQGIYLFRVFDANGNILGAEKIQIVK